ncbi:MAG: M4 family metallopeptidase, partial [Bacillota bacterium]
NCFINPIITIKKNKETIINNSFTLAYKIDFEGIGKVYIDAKNGSLIEKNIIDENISNKLKPILQSENKHNNSTKQNNNNSGNKGESKGSWEFNINQNFTHYYYNTTEWFTASKYKSWFLGNWNYCLYDECSGRNNLWVYDDNMMIGDWDVQEYVDNALNKEVVRNESSNWNDYKNEATTAFWALQRSRNFFYDYLGNNSFAGGINLKLVYNLDLPSASGKEHCRVYAEDAYVNSNIDGYILLMANYLSFPFEPCNKDHQVSLDIIGHKLTKFYIYYMWNWEHEIYNETKSIVVSFCDIFGKMNERWFWCNECFDYNIGEEYMPSVSVLRNMSNPQNSYSVQPTIFHGNYWDYDNIDYRLNSGVQNKWFYLLAEGGNFNGYHIDGIGVDKAFAIAHHNLKYYFDRYSTYPDARAGAIASAIDIFGDVCANEVIQTIKAWEAVEVPQTTSNWLVAENIDLLSPCAEFHTVLSNNDLVYVRAANELTSNCDISGYSDKEVHFVGNKISLKPGFRSGGNFRAYTTNCYPLDQSKLIMNNSDVTNYEHIENENTINDKSIIEDNELYNDQTLKIYPNPFTTSTTITFGLQQPSKVNIYITNSYGQKVHQVYNNFTEAGNYDIKLEGSGLQPGLYFCIMETQTKHEVIKIVKM